MKTIIMLTFVSLFCSFCNSQSFLNNLQIPYCHSDELYLSLPNKNIYIYNEHANRNKEESISYLQLYKNSKNDKRNFYKNLNKYRNVEILHVIGNFETIPKEIRSLPQLKYVVFSDNNSANWNEIFTELSKIESLKSIRINGSYVGIIPDNINLLKRLEYLHIQNSIMNGFGDGFKELTNLKTLIINQCGLMYLPSEYENPNLICLDLSNNIFQGIPEEIKMFTNLETFSFVNNVIFKEDFYVLCNLQNIKNLFLGSICYDSIPIELKCFEYLEFLWIQSKIKYLPKELENFKNLKYLWINNSNLKREDLIFFMQNNNHVEVNTITNISIKY